MKAKHFRKIRAKLDKIQTYTIRESFSLFGDFFGYVNGHTMPDIKVSTTSCERALKIYIRNFRRKNKKMHDNEKDEYNETTEKWGKLMVKDENGFMRFY